MTHPRDGLADKKNTAAFGHDLQLSGLNRRESHGQWVGNGDASTVAMIWAEGNFIR